MPVKPSSTSTVLPDLLVSVVVPTLGRPELRDAVSSCLAQTHGDIEVLVIADGAEARDRAARVLARFGTDSRVKLYGLSYKMGGAAARNIGTHRARGAAIAYLDDDDVWFPDKLERQLKAVSEPLLNGRTFLATCRTVFRRGARASAYPLVPLPDKTEIGPYLVARRRPWFGDTMIQASSLLVDATTAKSISWDEGLAKHQDWDFLIRAAGSVDHLLMTPGAPLVEVRQGTPGSVSKLPLWRSSAAFLSKHPQIRGRARADFVVVHLWARALETGRAGEVANALRCHRPSAVPHHGAMAVLTRAILRGMRNCFSQRRATVPE